MKADVEKGLEELRKLRAKIIGKADEDSGPSNRGEDIEDIARIVKWISR